METRLDRSDSNAKCLGRFTDGELFDVAQQEDLAIDQGQAGDGLLEETANLLAFGGLGGYLAPVAGEGGGGVGVACFGSGASGGLSRQSGRRAGVTWECPSSGGSSSDSIFTLFRLRRRLRASLRVMLMSQVPNFESPRKLARLRKA